MGSPAWTLRGCVVLLAAGCGGLMTPSTLDERVASLDAFPNPTILVPDTFRVGVSDTIRFYYDLDSCLRPGLATVQELGILERLVTPMMETRPEPPPVCVSDVIREGGVGVTFYTVGDARVFVRGSNGSDQVRDFSFETVVVP